MEPSIRINITFTGNQPLIRLFESNLDFDEVAVSRNEYAIKALIPLEFLIQVASVYAFEKFVLAPLIDPIAERFDWTQGVRKYLNPIRPFNLVVQIENENIVIEAPLQTNHQITEKIWEHIQDALDILKAHNLTASKIRFAVDSDGKLSVYGYTENHPAFIIDVKKKNIKTIDT